MKYIAGCCIVFFLITGCGNKEPRFENKTYEQQKASLADREKNNPLIFLKVNGEDKKNILGKTVVKGTITNNATVTSFKDVRIKMRCFKDDKQVEEHEDVIKENVSPNSTQSFKTRYRLPKGTDSIALSIMSAVYSEKK